MKKFLFLFIFISTILLFSFSASAFFVEYDFPSLLDTSDRDNYSLNLSDSFVHGKIMDYSTNSGILIYEDYSSFRDYYSWLSFFLCSSSSILDNSELSFDFVVFDDYDSLTFEVSPYSDFSDIVFSYSIHPSSDLSGVGPLYSFPSTRIDCSVSFTFSSSDFPSGNIYVRFFHRSATKWSLLSFSSHDIIGDVGILDTSSFTDLQYILDLLKSFFFGGTVSDPDTGQSFSFGKDGTGGIMNFVVYSSGGTNFALWHLLVASAIIGLGISFVVRLAGNFGRAPDNVAQSLHGDDD